MVEEVLLKLFEHNNWANAQILRACSAMTDEQLDAEPHSATRGTVRRTLFHIVGSQHHYLELLTLPVAARRDLDVPFAQLQQASRRSGDGFLVLLRDMPPDFLKRQLQTSDGFFVEPWVVMLQAINHATEHREQINSMRSALGLEPLDQDGWTYAEVTRAMVPVSA